MQYYEAGGENALKLKFTVNGSIKVIGCCILLCIEKNKGKRPKLKRVCEKTVGMSLRELVFTYTSPLRQAAPEYKTVAASVAGV